MIQRALVAIAGVDRDTLKTCPATDKVWAAHLGFSLCLSFIVVLGISFHATGYMIADPWMRGRRLAGDRAHRVHVRSRALPVGLVLSGLPVAVRAGP